MLMFFGMYLPTNTQLIFAKVLYKATKHQLASVEALLVPTTHKIRFGEALYKRTKHKKMAE